MIRIIKINFLLIFICFCFTNIVKSQDIIYLKEFSDTIYCHIVKDNIKNIEYRLVFSNDTSLHVISSNDIDGYVLSQNKVNKVKKETNTLTARDSVFLKQVQNDHKDSKKTTRIALIIISSVLAALASSYTMMPK